MIRSTTYVRENPSEFWTIHFAISVRISGGTLLMGGVGGGVGDGMMVRRVEGKCNKGRDSGRGGSRHLT